MFFNNHRFFIYQWPSQHVDFHASEWDCEIHFDSDGELHRIDGPALKTYDGFELWVQNKRLHRSDGPAINMQAAQYYQLYNWWYDGIGFKSFEDWFEVLTPEEKRKIIWRMEEDFFPLITIPTLYVRPEPQSLTASLKRKKIHWTYKLGNMFRRCWAKKQLRLSGTKMHYTINLNVRRLANEI